MSHDEFADAGPASSGGTETIRTPDDGATSYLGLLLGDSELDIVSDESVAMAVTGWVLCSIEVPDVDAALGRVEPHGGRAPAPANDRPWGQLVPHVQDPDGCAVDLTTTSG